jgi:ribosomal protein L32
MTLPVCKSCGKSTRSHSRQEYCAPCASALWKFLQKFGIQK